MKEITINTIVNNKLVQERLMNFIYMHFCNKALISWSIQYSKPDFTTIIIFILQMFLYLLS